jgi:hypothetical protein
MSLLGSQNAGSQVLLLTLVEAWKSTVGLFAEEPNTTLPLFSENMEEDRVIGQAIHPWLRLFYLELNVHDGHCYVFDLSGVCFFFFCLYILGHVKMVGKSFVFETRHWVTLIVKYGKRCKCFLIRLSNKRSDLGL